jgi:hypothetical protein
VLVGGGPSLDEDFQGLGLDVSSLDVVIWLDRQAPPREESTDRA